MYSTSICLTRGRPSQCVQKKPACFVSENCAGDKKRSCLSLTFSVVAALSQCLVVDWFGAECRISISGILRFLRPLLLSHPNFFITYQRTTCQNQIAETACGQQQRQNSLRLTSRSFFWVLCVSPWSRSITFMTSKFSPRGRGLNCVTCTWCLLA